MYIHKTHVLLEKFREIAQLVTFWVGTYLLKEESNSFKDLCKAKPCLTIKSWQVWRSSNLEPRVLITLFSSALSISLLISPSLSPKTWYFLKMSVFTKKNSSFLWKNHFTKKKSFYIPPMMDSSSSDSMRCMALALANSKAVTHLCLSTSDEALKWKVWVPPPFETKK